MWPVELVGETVRAQVNMMGHRQHLNCLLPISSTTGISEDEQSRSNRMANQSTAKHEEFSIDTASHRHVHLATHPSVHPLHPPTSTHIHPHPSTTTDRRSKCKIQIWPAISREAGDADSCPHSYGRSGRVLMHDPSRGLQSTPDQEKKRTNGIHSRQ